MNPAAASSPSGNGDRDDLDGLSREDLVRKLREFRRVQARAEAENAARIAELEAGQYAAEEASAAKSKFIAVMSHELRTPLNAIIGFSEMMEQELLGALGKKEYVGYAGDINRSGKHLLSIVNDVLEIARLQTGQLELTDEEVEVDAMVQSVLSLTGTDARQRSVRLDTEVQPGIGPLLADARSLRQILVNVVTNAIKFSDENSHVLFRVVASPEGGVLFQVIDTGCGISEDKIEQVFEAFTQADDDLARKHEGAGLGLTIARSLAEQHDGQLLVESRLGEGTTVTLDLPPQRVLGAAAEEDETVFDEDFEETETASASLRLDHAGQVREFRANKGDFLIGRNKKSDLNLICDLVVDDRRVSRPHARIVHRDGRFLLVDESRKGTWISWSNGESEQVHRATSKPLYGIGRLSLGVPCGTDENVEIAFMLIADEDDVTG